LRWGGPGFQRMFYQGLSPQALYASLARGLYGRLSREKGYCKHYLAQG